MKKEYVAIVGAGLAGSLLAVYLARRGFRVDVYERRPDMRREAISAGRSINLALSVRGIHALQEVGLAGNILTDAIPMKGRMMHSTEGELTFQPYGKDPREVINSVSRGGLNMLLLDAAESYDDVQIFFDERCTGADLDRGELQFRNERSGKQQVVTADAVIASDGSASAVRMEMQKIGRFNLSQQYLEHGYKELSIPPAADGGYRMEPHALHIWPRGSYMLIALPNPDGSFTCTLFLPFAGEPGFDSLGSPAKVRDFFRTTFADALPLIPDLETDFFQNPTGSLVTIKCFPWQHRGKMLLLGDAAHAIVPFYGQGMNCAFEDCTLLNRILGDYGPDWEQVFAAYQAQRKRDTDAIADLALENFIEMRDQVADPVFLRKRKVELLLETKFAGQFFSKYAMVTFQRLPYSLALERGRRQDAVLMEICARVERIEELDLDAVYAEVRQRAAFDA